MHQGSRRHSARTATGTRGTAVASDRRGSSVKP